MITIEYSPQGICYSDFVCEDVARQLLQSPAAQDTHQHVHIQTSTSLLIQAVRLWVSRGIIDHSLVTFLYNGAYLTINRWAVPEPIPCPEGWCDKDLVWAEEILRRTFTTREQEGLT